MCFFKIKISKHPGIAPNLFLESQKCQLLVSYIRERWQSPRQGLQASVSKVEGANTEEAMPGEKTHTHPNPASALEDEASDPCLGSQ